ncbi:phage tail tip fiber protein [Arsenophonus apicola]|uniref:phage tail tip fiber protein n=1 Tax=Arsenophonus apicola TaxID=2879119 RepID=UPI004046AFC1
MHYDGVSYDAGMVIGAELKTVKLVHRLALAPKHSSYTIRPMARWSRFCHQNGQVVMSSVFIGDGTITNAKIKNGAITRAKIVESLESDNYEKDKKGIKLILLMGLWR